MTLDPGYCQPSCTPPIPVIYQGADKTLDIFLTSQTSGDPVDITAATEIEAIFLNTDGTFLEKKLTTAGIAIISGPGGHFQIYLAAADTALLAVSASGGYSDVEIHLVIGGKTTIVVLSNAVNILARRYPTAP